MSDPLTSNISSTDAAIFQANTPNDNSDGDMDEDPIGKGGGASPIGQLDMFHGYPTKVVRAITRGGNSGPGEQMLLTPGAQKCPEIGPGKRGNGRKLA
jgi:hypothetical protein